VRISVVRPSLQPMKSSRHNGHSSTSTCVQDSCHNSGVADGVALLTLEAGFNRPRDSVTILGYRWCY
jgi:hypothetical protein